MLQAIWDFIKTDGAPAGNIAGAVILLTIMLIAALWSPAFKF